MDPRRRIQGVNRTCALCRHRRRRIRDRAIRGWQSLAEQIAQPSAASGSNADRAIPFGERRKFSLFSNENSLIAQSISLMLEEGIQAGSG